MPTEAPRQQKVCPNAPTIGFSAHAIPVPPEDIFGLPALPPPMGPSFVKILALETTEKTGSLAAMADGTLVAAADLPHYQRSAQSLAPAMRGLIADAGWTPRQIDLIAVVTGPGSFTGLRVGITTAKMLAYACRADILGLDTLQTIAEQGPEGIESLWAAVDAQRGDVMAQPFQRTDAGWMEPAGPAELIPTEAWLEGLPAGTILTGPFLRKHADRIPAGLELLPSSCWTPNATTVARLAARDHAAGRRDDLWTLLPHYCRRSAAEEKRDRP